MDCQNRINKIYQKWGLGHTDSDRGSGTVKQGRRLLAQNKHESKRSFLDSGAPLFYKRNP